MVIKTQIGIIGAGPAGLTLALLLHRSGIDCIILEFRSREYIEARTRAGLLEQNTVDILNDLGAAVRLNKDGLQHHGVHLSFNGDRIRVPFDELTGGRHITIYGQQEVIKDLIKINLERNIPIHFEAAAKRFEGIDSDNPAIHFIKNGEEHVLKCNFIAGCDGYHGISRQSMPEGSYNEFQKTYPFSWLGILAHAPPSSDELIYAYHQAGFALHSLRSSSVSRLYFQVETHDKLDNWTSEQIWDEMEIRLSDGTDFKLNRGEIFEKAITPVHSFLIDNMQYGKLFLAGDAAHIVPPTGGKGLNLAVADIKLLSEALIRFYKINEKDLLDAYTSNALRRVWRAQEFSAFMTSLFHKQSAHGSFEYHLQKAKFDYIKSSRAFKTIIAENYVGLMEI